jgi:endonuclease-3
VKALLNSSSFFKNKSKNIYNMCRELRDKYNKIVPMTMEELMSLSGVGRKTASVVLVEAFRIPAFPVDTHVYRVAKRLGIATGSNADKVSDEIMEKLSKNKWHLMHHLFINHGRQICTSISPKCNLCSLNNVCNHYKNQIQLNNIL